MSLRGALLVVVLATCAACGPPEPDQVTQGRWLRYHHWSDDVPCGEALEHLDALVDFVTARFGLRAQTLDYYKWRADEGSSVQETCNLTAGGCSLGTSAFTTGWAHDHEVVHALFDPVGYPPALFVEGIAMVYGCGGSPYGGSPVDPSVDLDRLLSSDAWHDEYLANGNRNYDAAASFVRWLLDAHGEASFVSFYARAPHWQEAESRRLFREVFGSSLEDALAAWRTSGVGRSGRFCVLALDPCQGPVDLGPGIVEMTRKVSCLGAVATVESGTTDAVAFGVESGAGPVTTALDSCSPDSSVETEQLIPRDAPIFPDASKFSTPGRQLEVRAFGLGPRALLRMHSFDSRDGFALGVDPESAPIGGPGEGEVTLRTLPDPERLWTPGCDGGATPLGQRAWGLHLTAPVSAIPPAGGDLRIQAEQPVSVLFDAAVGLRSAPAYCPPGCGASADAGCGSGYGYPRTDVYLRVGFAEDAGWSRFSLDLVVGR